MKVSLVIGDYEINNYHDYMNRDDIYKLELKRNRMTTNILIHNELMRGTSMYKIEDDDLLLDPIYMSIHNETDNICYPIYLISILSTIDINKISRELVDEFLTISYKDMDFTFNEGFYPQFKEEIYPEKIMKYSSFNEIPHQMLSSSYESDCGFKYATLQLDSWLYVKIKSVANEDNGIISYCINYPEYFRDRHMGFCKTFGTLFISRYLDFLRLNY